MRLNGLGIIRLVMLCGLRRSVMGGSLLVACLMVVQVALWNGVVCAPAMAQKVQRAADGFPGVGSHEAWVKAALLYNDAVDLVHSGKFDTAVSKLNNAITTYPFDDSFYRERGNALEKRHSFLEAEKDYRKGIEMNPGFWGNWSSLATSLRDQERYAEAKSACVKALDCNPPQPKRLAIEQNLSYIDDKLKAAHQ